MYTYLYVHLSILLTDQVIGTTKILLTDFNSKIYLPTINQAITIQKCHIIL